ncbi:MAG: tetratricopeptide repeat protein [Planctomycetes bacterium]|nr:tetratricopeptide repeat protein [Planctomycetota bacterium]
MVLAVVGGVLLVFLARAMVSRSSLFELSRRSPDSQEPHCRTLSRLKVLYPFDGTVYPPDLATIQFRWEDTTERVDRWRIRFEFLGGGESLEFVSETTEWTPPDDAWETIKRRTREAEATVTISGVHHSRPKDVLSQARLTVRTSKDEVGAPIFYREVDLPFADAVRDPETHVRWRFGAVSRKERPPIVLERLPVCGNCHSFSADGRVLGMDVDYANDKGSYAIVPVTEEISLSEERIITWSDFRREDGKKTFGLLSQVSPDGRYVVSTVKDLSVFRAVDDLTFSQLFFPIRGVLCVYDRKTKSFASLPGADDPRYVQSNPTWSPDGKYIVFARTEAYYAQEARANELGLTRAEEIERFLSERKTFRYDLYRVPFNGGRGGRAEPLEGASRNGRSNYFARYSPDGRWIVFCQANSFMLLQPDSELYIVPAEGGAARRLECNTSRMNSWHSWSPNSRWLVFSSKAFTPYTQLFLAHIDENGHASPPVVLAHFTLSTRAANIPEFVNAKPDAIHVIRNEFSEDIYHVQKGDRYALEGRYELAEEEFRKAIELNPTRPTPYRLWGVMLLSQGKHREAEQRFRKAIELQGDNKLAYWNLAKVMALTGREQEAIRTYRRAIELDPYLAPARIDFAKLLLRMGRVDQAIEQLKQAAKAEPGNPRPFTLLGQFYLEQGELHKAALAFNAALKRDPQHVESLHRLAEILIANPGSELYDPKLALQSATKACELTRYEDPRLLLTLSQCFAAVGMETDAVSSATAALRRAEAAQQNELAAKIRSTLERFKSGLPRSQGAGASVPPCAESDGPPSSSPP